MADQTEAAILTIEAASPGGVPALVDTLYSLLEEWGYQTTVYRTEFAPGNLSFSDRIAATVRNWVPREIRERGWCTMIVPAPPVPLWLFYAVPHFLIGRLLGKHPAVFAISGSAHVALPLALRGIPYTLWIATLYEDELRAKAEVGDQWAAGVLNSLTWKLLEAQERFILRHAAQILALSPYTARRISEFVPDAVDRVQTVLYPVDTERFQPSKAEREGYLLLAARLNDPRKNVPMLIRAFAQVHKAFPQLRLVLVGDHPSQSLLDLVQELGIREVVQFPGIVGKDELLKLYQEAELFVLPSRQEGLGIVMLEAMACGTPVITSAYGGPEQLVINGVTGRHLPSDADEQMLAQAIVDVLNQPEQLAHMRQQCVEMAARYAYPRVADQLKAGWAAAQTHQPAMRLRTTLAVGWSVVVITSFVQHQAALHWDAIYGRILQPLLNLP